MKENNIFSHPLPKKRSEALSKKKWLSLLLCLFLLLSGCGKKETAPEDVIHAMCKSQSSLPTGCLYVLSAPSDDAKHPSDRWLMAMFGKGDLPAAFSLVEDAAFFTSYTHACEFAVFLCKTSDGTHAVSQLCLQRLNTLKLYWEGVEASNVSLQNAGVTTRGKWVILYLCQDPAEALRAFRRTL